KIACPPSRVMPASKELRVRVEEKKKSMKRVLSSSKRLGRSSPHFILRSKARWRTVSSSSLLHSWVLIKSRPRRFVFILYCPFYLWSLFLEGERGFGDPHPDRYVGHTVSSGDLNAQHTLPSPPKPRRGGA